MRDERKEGEEGDRETKIDTERERGMERSRGRVSQERCFAGARVERSSRKAFINRHQLIVPSDNDRMIPDFICFIKLRNETLIAAKKIMTLNCLHHCFSSLYLPIAPSLIITL